MRLRLLLVLLLLTPACDEEPAAEPGPGPDAADGPGDAGIDAALPEPEPEPGPWRVGAAVARMPVPVGIGTSGFGPSGGLTSKSPFANVYPATTRVHTHPDLRAVVFEAGEGRLIVVRTDTIGVTEAFRQSLVARLEARFGPDVDAQLLLAATHTHSGPGRLIDKPLWNLIADDFFPEFYERMVDALEAVVLAAADDLEPALVGHGLVRTTSLHSDRRCANAEEDEPELPFVRADRAGDGSTKALLLFHAIHGTVLGMSELSLSQDVSGGVEAKVAEEFDHPVTVLFLNGAAGDMAPAGASVEPVAGAAPWPEPFARTEALGMAAAAAMRKAADVTPSAEGVIRGLVVRAPLSLEALGYEGDEFPHEYGAVYCGAAYDERCLGEPKNPDALQGCLPLPDEANAAPDRSPVSVFQLGERLILTGPGEFSVALARRAREEAARLTGLSDVVFVGYAQDYTGYSLPEDDWWQGGYEASGALWGPKQGDHLADAIVAAAAVFANPSLPLTFDDPGPLPTPGAYDFEPLDPTPSAGPAEVLADVPAEVAADAVGELTFAGGDPWLGAPLVTLESRQADGSFVPVTGPGGRVVDSDGYEMTLSLSPDPPYRNRRAPVRTFAWTVRLPMSRTYGGGPDLSDGAFRLVARGRLVLEGGEPTSYEIASGVFE